MDLLGYDVSEVCNSVVVSKELLLHKTKHPLSAEKKEDRSASLQLSEKARIICSKPRYRLRWFSSKAAYLVLVWSVMLNVSTTSLENTYTLLRIKSNESNAISITVNSAIVEYVPYLTLALVAPILGWVADSLYGTYKVAKFGILLLFLSVILECVICLVTPDPVQFDSRFLVPIVLVSNIIGYVGQAVMLVMFLTLGLDQMPDASTSNITSFISWFVCSMGAGYWICIVTSYIPVFYILQNPIGNVKDYVNVWSLFPVLCVSFVLVTDFILTPKWLTIEPKSPKSLKTIYRVLKFAAKHKAPINRSALTYWEEDIPSRIDLGKSRYGGPFTTEQVEDVKTFLRLLVISVPVFLNATSFYLCQDFPLKFSSGDDHSCQLKVVEYAIANVSTIVVGTVIYEFMIYPFISHLLPSIFKRIGVASFLVALLNTVYLGLYVAKNNTKLTWESWIVYPHSVVNGLLIIVWTTSVLELVCAQSPHDMRGLLIGYFWCLNLLSYTVYGILSSIIMFACSGKYCLVLYGTVSTLISFVGFILYCILARWYKRRVRDDISTPHRWVEDAYDRYLTSSS